MPYDDSPMATNTKPRRPKAPRSRGRVFDRLVKYDEKSLNFPMRALLPDAPLRTKSWAYVQLDQGSRPACTGFSTTEVASSNPKPEWGTPSRVTRIEEIQALAGRLYDRAQQLDEWPGEQYDGSSVLGAMKAAVEKGWCGGYRWALGPGAAAAAQDVFHSVSLLGPVVIGSNWYDGMFTADFDGYLQPTGKVAGGHAFPLTKFSVVRDAVWTPNNWGGAGQGWISRRTLTKLLEEQGDAALMVDRKILPAKQRWS